MSQEFTITKLKNGFTVITCPIRSTNSVSICLTVRAGPKYEDKKTAGLAHFLEHMLYEGTANLKTAEDVAIYLEKFGGRSSAWTDKEFVSYWAKVPKHRLEDSIHFLSEILFKSKLETKAIQKEIRIVTEEQNRENDNPEWITWKNWCEMVFGEEHYLGRSTLGDKKTIPKINQKVLKSYLEKFYHPANMSMVIAGNFDQNQALKLTKLYFSKQPNNKSKFSSNSPHTQVNPRLKIIKAGLNQCQVLFGIVTKVNYANPDRYPLMVLADFLGGGFSSILFQKIVYEEALAYTFYVSNLVFADTGVFCIYGGFTSKNIPKASKIVASQLGHLRTTGISQKDLDLVKERIKANYYYLEETPDSLANLYASQFATEGKIIDANQMSKIIDGISLKDIKRVVDKYLNFQKACILVNGPVEKTDEGNLRSYFKNLT